MRVVVIGGSAAGLLTALLLARAGYPVTVVDRDDVAPAPDVEAAAATAFRPAAPQLVQPHGFGARFRELMRRQLPDVYANFLAAGAVEGTLADNMPPPLRDRAPRPGDERLAFLMSRRSTLDWVLRRAAAAEPGIELRGHTRVCGLLADTGTPPRVRGVRTEDGELAADQVVDASGRRSRIDDWLSGIGARRSSMTRAECGMTYYSRQYRLTTRSGLPGPVATRLTFPLPEFFLGVWAADRGTMQIAIAPLAEDTRFHTARDPEVFAAVLRAVPACAAWLDVLEPITPLAVMGGLHNTLRRLVLDGEPVAYGVHCIGDALCTTNPTFGRGTGMAIQAATDLVQALRDHPDDPRGQVLALNRDITDRLEPWFADQARVDAGRLAGMRHTVLGAPPPEPASPAADRVTFPELGQYGAVDPMVLRGIWRMFTMTGLPDDVYRDPELVRRVRTLRAEGVTVPPMPQPTRGVLETALRVPAGRAPGAHAPDGLGMTVAGR